MISADIPDSNCANLENFNCADSLVQQKNGIIDLINRRKFYEARAIIDALEYNWKENDYAYKTQEMRDRLEQEWNAFCDERGTHSCM